MRNLNKILVVEDDHYIREELIRVLSKYGRCFSSTNSIDATKLLEKDLGITHAFIDLDLEEKLTGIKVIKECKNKKIRSLVLTSHENEQIVSKCISLGVDRYYDKINYFESFKEVNESFFHKKLETKKDFDDFFNYQYITREKSIVENIKLIFSNHVSHDRVIQIQGPTGTGKSKLAKLIHDQSSVKGSFISFNVSDHSPSLIKTKLFGAKKGSYTGAIEDIKGVFELANNGTLFLDEVGEMTHEMQKALLVALESKEIWPEGAQKPIKCNVRLICAGNNILKKVKEGALRDDFYYRISDFVVMIKSLSKRREDIKLQAIQFARDFSKMKGNGLVSFSEEAMSLLQDYSWEGNSRELRNEIKGIIDRLASPLIKKEDLSERIINYKRGNRLKLPDSHLEIIEEKGFKNYIEELEALIVDHYVFQKKQSKRKAGQELGISKDVMARLYNVYQKHEVANYEYN